jgi:hypothetical protein
VVWCAVEGENKLGRPRLESFEASSRIKIKKKRVKFFQWHLDLHVVALPERIFTSPQ